MKRFTGLFSDIAMSGLLLFVLASPLAASPNSSAHPKTSGTDALARTADVIVVGRVAGLVHEWTSDHARIQTRVTFAVDQTIKGADAGRNITVIVPGGEVDGVGEWYSHTARFMQDEDVVLFAKKDQSGSYRVAGGEEGKLTITKDARTGARIVPQSGTVEQFTARIKSILKSQDQNAIGK